MARRSSHTAKAGEHVVPEGHHAHRCQCGYVWQHSDENAGSEVAHTCVCGREVYERVAEGGDSLSRVPCFVGEGRVKLPRAKRGFIPAPVVVVLSPDVEKRRCRELEAVLGALFGAFQR